MTYLLTAAALTMGAVLLIVAIDRIQHEDRQTAVWILAGLVAASFIWAGMLGLAQIRLAHDRHFCSVDQNCISRRESARWGPYHLFGSNFKGD